MTRIWADSQAIKDNFIADRDVYPVIAVEQDGERVTNASSVEILGPSRVLYERDARPQVWLETQSEVVLR